MSATVDEIQDHLPALRARILRMIHDAGAGHPGGSLSVIDTLAVIMQRAGRFQPGHEQDWLVLAKGHAVPALYAMLVDLGHFDESELATYRHDGSRLQGHPDRRKVPGVQVSTGHLGQGLSIALGIALGEQRRGSDAHVWAVMGEGDLHEGQTWEAAMAAAHHGAANLTAVLDRNGLTQHDRVEDVMAIEPVVDKFGAFGWSVHEADGHDPAALDQALADARQAAGPALVLAHTKKGHGVSFMEGNVAWHSRGIEDDELARALAEVEA